MDTNDIRSIVTVVSLVMFLGIVRWAWSRKNASQFAEAANLPFAEDEAVPGTDDTNHKGSRP